MYNQFGWDIQELEKKRCSHAKDNPYDIARSIEATIKERVLWM